MILDFLSRGRSHRYGPASSQRADLYLPSGPGPHPVMVLIHGGSWSKRYGKIVMRGLAGDLVRRGWAVWNIEYRRLGDGGGWPTTFEDVATAIDHLAELDEERLDLERVTILGHSAGGHLALWAAGRSNLPAGAPGALGLAIRETVTLNGSEAPDSSTRLDRPARIQPRRVISMAGVADLGYAYRLWHGGAVRALMGGSPEEVPERYAAGDPIRLLPLSIPALLVHGVLDETVSVKLSRSYVDATRAAGGEIELVEIQGPAGRHRAHIDPRGDAWAAVIHRLAPTGQLPAAAAQDPDIPSGQEKPDRNEVADLLG
jgi:acetyl esterase/lipase